MSNDRAKAKKALFREDARELGRLVESGWAVDELDWAGRSLLWYAAADGRWDQAGLLLALGAEPLHALDGFMTQGDLASERLRALVGRVRSVNAILPSGRRALNWACRRGAVLMIDELLELGADPDREDSFGMSPLGDLTRRFSAPAADALRLAGAEVSGASQRGGQTLAHHAVYWDAPRALDWLLKNEAPLDSPNERNETPLERAIALGRSDCARRLIAAGADVSRVGSRGKTPLYWAIAKGREDLARALMDAGADPEQRTGKNGQGRSAIGLARQNHSGKGRALALPTMEKRALQGALSESIELDSPRSSRAKSL